MQVARLILPHATTFSEHGRVIFSLRTYPLKTLVTRQHSGQRGRYLERF